MKAQVQITEGLQRKLNVEINQAVVKSAFEKAYQDIQRQVEIKGFRKGKAPLTTIRLMYKDRIQGDVAQDLISKHYPVALQDQKIEPISYPEFEFDDPTEEKDFMFAAIFDVRPEVKVKKWEGLEIEKEKYTFDPAKIDQVIANIRNSKAEFVPVLDDRPAQMGDAAIIDFEGIVNGKPLENGSGQDHNLELGSKQFIDGYEEGICGMKIGQVRTLDLKFPTPYHAKELEGQPVSFKVTLKSLKKKVLPEMTDDLLKTIGANQTVEEFKKTVQEDTEQTEKKRIEDSFKNRLLKKLVLANPVDVPASLMKEQKGSLIEDFKKRMTEQGMQPTEFEDYVQKWDSDFAKTAGEMIQSSFLIDKLSQEHNLICTQADLDNKYEEYSKQTGIEIARIKDWYNKPEQTSRLTYQITEEKVMKLLTEKAKIKEVDAKDIKEESN